MEMKRPRRLTRRLIAALRKLRVFPRLLLVFCTLLIASTLFISLLNQGNFAREIESTTVDYLSLLVQNAAYRLEQETTRMENVMGSFTQDDAVMRAVQENKALSARHETEGEAFAANRQLIQDRLMAVREQTGGLKAILFVTGQQQYSVPADAVNGGHAYIRDLDAFYGSEIYQEAVAARGYPSWLDATQQTSQLFYETEEDSLGIIGCVTLAYQVYAPVTREPLGVLVCCVYPTHLTEALREYASRDGGNTFLVGEQGLLEGIAADFSGPPFLRQRSVLLRQVFAQESGSCIIESDGRELLASYSARPGFPVHVVNLTYRDRVLTKVRQMEQTNLLVLALVVLAGTVCFYFAAVSIAYPVNKLIRAMKRVGQGDFTAVYHPESRDEIGILCNEFDQMVVNMQSLIDQVYVAQLKEQELRLSERTAQLDMLQMQISPHFLYNTLDMIRWECMYEGGPESRPADMIEKFCALLRMTINRDKTKESVADSLLHAATYLEVVNFRHTHPIRMETAIAFPTGRYQLPRLTLQPILENAVRHGFAGEEKEDRLIRVTGELAEHGRLRLCVTDNGHGMTAEQLAALRSRLADAEVFQDSIGLKNVHQRCRLCYGEGFGLSIDSQPGRGTRVTLLLPADLSQQEETHV